MAFFAPTFKVVLATIHVSLRDALAQISTEHYLRLIRFVDAELRRFRFAQRRITVAIEMTLISPGFPHPHRGLRATDCLQ